MKKILVIALLILSGNFAYSQSIKPKTDFKKLKWLSGNWIRTNNKPGQTGEESWKIVSPSRLTGKGYTLKGTDTVFIERLSILRKNDDLFYVVNMPDEPKPTYFKFTSITDDSFVCENAANDFPKKIAYKLVGKEIKATISGGGKNVDFFFSKKD